MHKYFDRDDIRFFKILTGLASAVILVIWTI